MCLAKVESPNEKDFKHYEPESAAGKINHRIKNSVSPSIENQLAKFKQPKDGWDYFAQLNMQTEGPLLGVIAKAWAVRCEKCKFESREHPPSARLCEYPIDPSWHPHNYMKGNDHFFIQ